MSRFLWLVALFMFCFTQASPLAAKQTNQFEYDPSLSILFGRLELQKFADQMPPYYELKDNPPQVDVLVFIPDHPVDVISTIPLGSGPNEDSFNGVSDMEIDPPPGEDMLKRYIGQHVKIVGYLDERTAGFQYTNVLLSIESINVESR